MAKLGPKRGTTSKLVRVFIRDTSSAAGDGLTGLAYNTAGLVAYYTREGDASPTAITLVTATVGTWVSGGFKEISLSNMPGWYELGLPNAALASGGSVGFQLKGATSMAQTNGELELNAYDPQAADLGLGAVGLLLSPIANSWGEALAMMRAFAHGIRGWAEDGTETFKAHDDSTVLMSRTIKDRDGNVLGAPASGVPTQRT